MTGEFPTNPENMTSSRERAQALLQELYGPEYQKGVERIMNLSPDRLKAERDWVQKWIDKYRDYIAHGEPQGIVNMKIVKYEDLIPELEKELEAIDMLIQEDESNK